MASFDIVQLCGLEWNCCEKTCFRKACQKPFLLPSITAFELRLFTIVLARTTLQLVWPYILLIWTLTLTCLPGLTLDLLHYYRCVGWSLDCWLNLITATRPFSLSLFSTAILHSLPTTSLPLPILLSPSASSSPPLVEQIILTVPCNVQVPQECPIKEMKAPNHLQWDWGAQVLLTIHSCNYVERYFWYYLQYLWVLCS